MTPLTVCRVCWTETAETLQDHLAARHANELFRITDNPATGRAIIHERVAETVP